MKIMQMVCMLVVIVTQQYVRAQSVDAQKLDEIKGLSKNGSVESGFNFKQAQTNNKNAGLTINTYGFQLSPADIRLTLLYADYIDYHLQLDESNQSDYKGVLREDYSYPFILNSRLNNYVIAPLSK